MIYTVLDARKAIAKYVLGGRCYTDSSVISALNEAVEILLEEGDWKHTVQKIIMNCSSGCIALPRGVDTILKANYCKKPMNVWTSGWEFLSSGPGTMDFGNDTIYNDMADMGWHPTFYPLGGFSLKLMAFSTSSDYTSLALKIWGTGNAFNQDIIGTTPTSTNSGAGENLTIGQWVDGVDGAIDQTTMSTYQTANDYKSITRIEKPKTAGYITLIGVDSSNNIGFLGKYPPTETIPSYRRYRVTGRTQTTTTNEESPIAALVKMGFYTLEFDDDVVPVQHIPAIRQMVMAQQEKRDGDFSKGAALHGDAIRLLNVQLGNSVRNQAEFDVRIDGGYEFGSSPNMV